MKKIFQTILVSAFVASTLSAQVNTHAIFSNDSLKGFDETAFINDQVSHGISGSQLKRNIQIAKKEYIFVKYYRSKTNPSLVMKTTQATTVNPGCTNMDFEVGSFAGWTLTNGSNSNSTTMAGCCPAAGGISQVINSVGTDPVVPALSLVSPFGGNKIAQINDVSTGAVVERIAQSFNVTSSNAIFQFAYAGVLENAGHSCSDQPYMNVSVIDSAGNTLACPNIVIAAPSSSCSQPTLVTAGWIASGGYYYHNWEVKTIDLSPYIGTSITIQITVGDCAQGGHSGYGYFDCKCYPLEISLNGTIFDATPQTPINVSTCGAITGTVIAPYGLDPYTWNGPPASGVVGVTTQSMVTSTPATYTLTMNPVGNCYGPITKYIILNVSPNPTLTTLSSQATCTNATGSGTIGVISGTAPFTYNWLPAASTGSIGTGLSPGTDYTVTVVDTFGCRNTTTVSIASFTNGPTYTITPLTALLNCNTTSLTVSALTGTNTTAVWSNTTTPTFVVNSAGSYTCVVTNTVSSCTATVPVTISSNTIAPIATNTVICNTTTVSLNATSTAGVALGWLAPTTPPSPVSNPGTSTASGIFTLTATNLSTGCKSTYTVSTGIPNISVTSTSNSLTCVTNTISATASTTSPSTTIVWTTSTGTTSTNPLLINAPGSYTSTVNQTGGCSTQSVVTVTTNTLVGINVTSPSTIIPCSTGSLALTGNGTVGGTYTYTWTPSSPSFVGNPLNITTPGVYTVVATNSANGCTTTATYAVSAETISASFVADPYQGLMPLPVSFTNTNIQAGVSYAWDLANGSTPSGSVVSTTYNYQGNYPVVLTATKGVCVDTAMRIIKVELVSFLTVPNVFTPNNDTKNDVFYLDAINMGEIYMIVYDRWGLKMFEATESGKMAWDGKTKSGNTVSDGTYFYVIKATGLDGQTYDMKGSINVFK